jgi:hypothetical protein
MTKKKISECLDTIGVLASHFEGCQSLQEEFKAVKKVYFTKILEAHPDKGGDPEVFRSVQTSFEILREIFTQSKISSFVAEANHSVDDFDLDYEETYQDFGGRPTPSWAYYHEAAEDDVPLYRVELAKSSRGRCFQTTKIGKKCGEVDEIVNIEKGEIRVGRMDFKAGNYAYWAHLRCWRVPSRIWLGLPNPDTETDPKAFADALGRMEEVLLCGFAELPKDKQLEVVEYVMDKENHAALRKSKKKKEETESSQAEDSKPAARVPSAPAASAAVGRLPSDAVAVLKNGRQVFVPPVPGKNGGVAGALSGKTIVLTGIFPEVGGGAGLSLGKDKVKSIIESFGGRVTGSVSGKTSFLLVGKEPGMSKVSKARGRSIQLMGLHDLKQVCEGLSLQDAQPAVIAAFSSGYGNNGKALTASRQELEALRAPPPKPGTAIEAEKKPAAKKSKKKATTGSKTKKKNPPPTVNHPKATASKNDVDVKPPARKRKSTATNKKAAPKAEPVGTVENVTPEDDVDVKPPAKKLKKTAIKKKAAPKAEPVDTENVTPNELSSSSCNNLDEKKLTELKDLCKENGLKVSGKKAELKTRLEEHYASTVD